MSDPDDGRPRVAGEEMPESRERHRDPGADLEAEGVPDIADESTTGKGEVPEPEEPIAPGEMPTVRTSREMGARSENPPRGVDEYLAAERRESDEPEWEADQRAGPAEEAAIQIEDEPED